MLFFGLKPVTISTLFKWKGVSGNSDKWPKAGLLFIKDVVCGDGICHVYMLCRLSLPIFPLLAMLVEKLKIHTPVSEQVSMVCEICDASSHGNFMLLCSSLAISYLVSGEKKKRRTNCSRGA